ncbi:hypothetical protein M8J77_005225 [Diaphorina citri]|nr:hypothetical protein M8J77_005225 [Diaphorina citri]
MSVRVIVNTGKSGDVTFREDQEPEQYYYANESIWRPQAHRQFGLGYSAIKDVLISGRAVRSLVGWILEESSGEDMTEDCPRMDTKFQV